MQAIKIISENFHYFDKNAQIIDLWIWEGRNAYFLADKNFQIIGIDYNENILKNISHKNIFTICTDIEQYLSENNIFENVLANFSLRFTGEKNFLKNIETIQNSTKMGGINIISDFIDDGSEFVKMWAWKDFYWLQNRELEKLYQNENWEIIVYFEEKIKTKIQKENGEFFFSTAAFILARKIKNF